MTTAEAPILELKNIHVVHKTRSGSLFNTGTVHAVNDVSIDVRRGTTIGIVGEVGLWQVHSGQSHGRTAETDVRATWSSRPKRSDPVGRRAQGVRRAISIVFQDPATALNPRMTVADILTDPLDVHGIGNRASRTARVRELVGLVGLPQSALEVIPSQISGGQRQRVADRACTRART